MHTLTMYAAGLRETLYMSDSIASQPGTDSIVVHVSLGLPAVSSNCGLQVRTVQNSTILTSYYKYRTKLGTLRNMDAV